MTKTISKNKYQYGWRDDVSSVNKPRMGLSVSVVEEISAIKKEPVWMRDFRLRALVIFQKKEMPSFGPSLTDINFDEIYYYLKPTKNKAKKWEDVPQNIRNTYEKLGIPTAERRYLSGVEAQFDSEMIYGRVKKEIEKKGVIFCDTDTALREYPDLVKQYLGTVIKTNDNKFSALNSAVWSGGSFVYVPKGVRVDFPLQTYFRINADKMGQFERTLILADEGSFVHYVEGCSSPIYTADSLHAAVVEIIVKKGARVRYTTIQNWSKNVYNLVTKRALVLEEGIMEFVDANLGSKVTMKYPACVLAERKAKGSVLSMAFAGKGQIIDSGGKMTHIGPETTGTIITKSISKDGGSASYRGQVLIQKGAWGAKSKVKCDALILDKASSASTYPHIKIMENDVEATHEAVTGKLNEDQLFYLQSRGVKQEDAEALLINGFIEPMVRELPIEYAVELNRLIKLEMEGSVG